MLFLLAAAPLSTGCIITTDDGDTENAGTANATDNATGNATDNATGNATDDPTGNATDDPTGNATDDPTGAMDTTAGGMDTTAGETEDPPPAICVTYADQVELCYDDVAGMTALDNCIEYRADYEAYGEDCLGVWEDYLACLSALTCEEFTDDMDDCPTEFEAVETTCVAK